MSSSSALVSLQPVYNFTPTGSSMSFQGLVETYYSSVDPTLVTSEGAVQASPIDVSLRNISSPSFAANFSSFKHNSGALVSFTALLQLNMTGVWGVQILAASSVAAGGSGTTSATGVLINGKPVPLDSKTRIGTVLAGGKGKNVFVLAPSAILSEWFAQDGLPLSFGSLNPWQTPSIRCSLKLLTPLASPHTTDSKILHFSARPALLLMPLFQPLGKCFTVSLLPPHLQRQPWQQR